MDMLQPVHPVHAADFAAIGERSQRAVRDADFGRVPARSSTA